jgi:hypothetical protein
VIEADRFPVREHKEQHNEEVKIVSNTKALDRIRELKDKKNKQISNKPSNEAITDSINKNDTIDIGIREVELTDESLIDQS